MSIVPVLLSVFVLLPAIGAALALPSTLSARPPKMDHHGLTWRAGPVRRERMQWQAAVMSAFALAGTVLSVLASNAAATEAAHGFGPHAHFALSPEGVLTAVPVGWQLWALLPSVVWLLPIPLLALATLAVPIFALQARWRLSGRSDRLFIQRSWPWQSRVLRWSEITGAFSAGATLHIETRRGPVALRADGAELDVAAVATWIAAARSQARDQTQILEPPEAGSPSELQALRARARERRRSLDRADSP